MTALDLTAIRADLERRASWQRMSSMEFIRNVSASQVNDLNQRLIRAVPVLVDEVTRLQALLDGVDPRYLYTAKGR